MLTDREKKIYTIGTSSRDIEEFIDILKSYNIQVAVDVRSFPSSKRYPHFNQNKISEALKKSEIEYVYLGKELGGFRKGGYEKYILTEDFIKGIDILEEIASQKETVFFCCEKMFFKCHRRFIAQFLFERGWRVYHIIEKDRIIEENRFLSQISMFSKE
ncbi:DUF488 domain-containing protein [Thermodesulfovibrio hydrogeniphilus]